jgi:gluconate 2-dehydrogenase alpha chain
VVGKNYAYQTMSSVNVFFDDKILNPFIGAGALAMSSTISTATTSITGPGLHRRRLHRGHGADRRAADRDDLHARGHAGLGLEWKHAAAKNYLRSFSLSVHGSCMSHRGNYLDLDPTYRDIHGRPMLRMTFDFTENEHKMSDYLTDRAPKSPRP